METIVNKAQIRNLCKYILVEYQERGKTATLRRVSDNLEIEVEIKNETFETEFTKMVRSHQDRVAQKKPPPIWQAHVREGGNFLSMRELKAEKD